MSPQTPKLRICLLGQPFWAERLRATLDLYCPGICEFSTLFPLRSFSRDNWEKAVNADMLLRVGYRPGAATPMGIAFEAFFSLLRRRNRQAATVYYWIGTDVLNAVRDVRQGRVRSRFFESARQDIHIADAPWLVEELASIGVQAERLSYPAPILKADAPPALPDRFSVLSYVPDRRFRFYGGPAILEAARSFPRIPFHIVGGTGKWAKDGPANLQFHGWQKDMRPFYRNASVVVRLVRHDAVGTTAQEALCFARHLIYSYPLPHSLPVAVDDGLALRRRIGQLFEEHQAGVLAPNLAGWQYGVSEFDEQRYSQELLTYLAQCLHRTRAAVGVPA